jgi:hypothetical protein
MINRPLTLTLNFVIHKSPIKENYDNQKHLIFDKNKVDLFLKDLNNELNLLPIKDNIEDLYHNFTITLSISTNNREGSLLRCRVKRKIEWSTLGMIKSVRLL